jgi:hypothetical protein
MFKPKSLVSHFSWILAILALNVFLISPQVTRFFGEIYGSLIYILIRLVCVLAFSRWASMLLNQQRMAVVRWTTLLVFIDQVLFKAIFLWLDIQGNPSSWQGVDLKAAYYGLFLSYIISVPFVVLLAFVGAELSSVRLRKSPA